MPGERKNPMRSKTMSKRTAAKRPAGRTKTMATKRSGTLPEWNFADLYSGLDDPAIKRDLDRADADCVAFENALQGQARRAGAFGPAGAALAEAVRRYEAIDDLMGRLGSYAGLVARRRHGRSGAHQILWRRAGAADRGLDASVCSSRSSLIASTMRFLKRRWPIRRSAIIGRGSKTCAATGRISSKIASSSCSTKNR